MSARRRDGVVASAAPLDAHVARAPVVVVGAGPVGLVLAAALQRSGVDCILVGALSQPPTSADAGPTVVADHAARRPIALSLASVRLLGNLDLWPLPGLGAGDADGRPLSSGQAIRRVHVSQRGRFGVVRMHAERLGVEAFGYVVDSDRLQQALLERVTRIASVATGLRLMDGRVRDLSDRGVSAIAGGCAGELRSVRLVAARDGDGSARLSSSAVIETPLVCLTGGTGLLVHGVRERRRRYPQDAIATWVRVSRPAPGSAFERFHDGEPFGAGIMGLLPMGGDRYGLVWSLATGHAEFLARCDATAFIGALQSQLGRRLGCVLEVGSRRLFPLALELRRVVGQPRVLLLGGAARRLHPVAGQALNLALRDVAELVEQLGVARRDGLDVGSATLIERFHQRRFGDRARVGIATHALVRGFSLRGGLPAMLRGLGMFGLDLADPIKLSLAAHAAGLGPGGASLIGMDPAASSLSNIDAGDIDADGGEEVWC